MVGEVIGFLLGAAILLWLIVLVFLRPMARSAQRKQQAQVALGIECPTCHTKGKVRHIRASEKLGSVTATGVFAVGKVAQTFICGHCGYRW